NAENSGITLAAMTETFESPSLPVRPTVTTLYPFDELPPAGVTRNSIGEVSASDTTLVISSINILGILIETVLRVASEVSGPPIEVVELLTERSNAILFPS